MTASVLVLFLRFALACVVFLEQRPYPQGQYHAFTLSQKNRRLIDAHPQHLSDFRERSHCRHCLTIVLCTGYGDPSNASGLRSELCIAQRSRKMTNRITNSTSGNYKPKTVTSRSARYILLVNCKAEVSLSVRGTVHIVKIGPHTARRQHWEDMRLNKGAPRRRDLYDDPRYRE